MDGVNERCLTLNMLIETVFVRVDFQSGTSVARFCLAGFTSCRYWFCCNPFVDCLSDMYNFGVDDSVSNNLTADTPDDGEPRSVFGTGLPEVCICYEVY